MSKTDDNNKKRQCKNCQHIDPADTLNTGPAGVGWCVRASQYRHMSIERTCDSFTGNKTKAGERK